MAFELPEGVLRIDAGGEGLGWEVVLCVSGLTWSLMFTF